MRSDEMIYIYRLNFFTLLVSTIVYFLIDWFIDWSTDTSILKGNFFSTDNPDNIGKQNTETFHSIFYSVLFYVIDEKRRSRAFRCVQSGAAADGFTPLHCWCCLKRQGTSSLAEDVCSNSKARKPQNLFSVLFFKSRGEKTERQNKASRRFTGWIRSSSPEFNFSPGTHLSLIPPFASQLFIWSLLIGRSRPVTAH